MHAAVVAAGDGRHENAVELFTQALKTEGLPARTLASIYYRRGLSSQKLGRTGQAIADYTQTLSLKILQSETRAVIHYNRALAYDSMGDVRRALADIDAALQLKPNFPEAYNNRGNLYRRLERFPEAISDFETSIALNNPMPHLPLFALGLTFEAMGEEARAFDYFNAAYEANPDFAPAREKAFAAGVPSPRVSIASAPFTEAEERIPVGEGDADYGDEPEADLAEDATGAIPSAHPKMRTDVRVAKLAPPPLRPALDAAGPEDVVSGPGAIVQLAAFSSPERVDMGWAAMAKQYPDILSGYAPMARPLLRADAPPLYALQVHTEGWERANRLCTQLRARGENCVVKAAR